MSERRIAITLQVDEDRLEELKEYLGYLKNDFDADLMAWLLPTPEEDEHWDGAAPITTWYFA